MKKLAWVSGSKAVGYRLWLEYQDDRIKDFKTLHGSSLGSYRAAQDIANAINAHVKARAAK